ncbi:MAG: CRISPR-associated protein Cas4 [Clostridiales bacterium]|nr:CRISPR-associated protein Cas4 [Clostridiales bacterium]
MVNDDSDFLMLSGLKHFQFCRRRWALVHIEQLWEENALTLEGHYMHERVHDNNFTEARGSVLLSRGMPVRSQTLKITGVCDMVELYKDESGIPIQGRGGRWRLYPVEYKLGRPDVQGADALQLCAQAMCLEEMFVTEIPEGALYYGKTKHRQKVLMTEELRKKVKKSTEEMHQLMEKGYTPKAKMGKACKSCSLVEICQPKLRKQVSASEYIRRAFHEFKEDST